MRHSLPLTGQSFRGFHSSVPAEGSVGRWEYKDFLYSVAGQPPMEIEQLRAQYGQHLESLPVDEPVAIWAAMLELPELRNFRKDFEQWSDTASPASGRRLHP